MECNVNTEIQFSGLKSGIYHYDYTLDDSFFSEFKNEKILGGKVFFDVKLEKKERLMLFFFAYNGKVRTECDRCLGEMEWPIEGEETICVKLSDTETSDDENVVILPESAYKIDLAQWMYEFVAVAMPIQCVHPDDADGNPTCDPEMLKYISDEIEPEDEDENEPFDENDENEENEESREIDPRWEALMKLRSEK